MGFLAIFARVRKTNDLQIFGEAVRKHRERSGLTVGELGKQVGKYGDYIYRLERAHEDPNISDVIKVAGVLVVSLNELYTPFVG